MSLAGIRSNRGDGYQTMVALDWALTVLSDPDYDWIEIDSINWLVDDVVIGKRDGTIICCQCKKNQIDYKHWNISDLADEFKKAAELLSNRQQSQVRFYSRSPFGDIAKLREHSTTQSSDQSYYSSLSIELKNTDSSLSSYLAHSFSISTYQFLCRISFEVSPELDRMQTLIRERLRHLTCHSDIAFNALWTHLDQLGARMSGEIGLSASVQHRLTKQDLQSLLNQSGAMLAPIMNLVEVRNSFASISSIGRIWQRSISDIRIPNPVKNKILAAIDAKQRAILLTGLPGSGKTCVMLDIQEELEQRTKNRTDQFPIFIQSREFADLATSNEFYAKGLPDQWVEKIARMTEASHIVIIIDSLDVLSIAREHAVLDYFLAQIDRLLKIPNVTIVTACREFDRKYDHRIAQRRWDCELRCMSLTWETEIAPLLQNIKIDLNSIDNQTRDLIKNPRELALFVELAKRDGGFNVVTSQALVQRYLDTVVKADQALGEEAMEAIEEIAAEMLKSRSLVVSNQRFKASQSILRALLSKNVLHESQDGNLTFGHQTLLDVLVISGSLRQGVTLNGFIQSLPPVPFVRPSIRSYVTQLAAGNRATFRKQLRAVLTGDAAFHIRRLVAESFAEQKPSDEDWPLLHDLRIQHREIFQIIYFQAKNVDWHYFWLKHLTPDLISNQDHDGILMHANLISQWKNDDTISVLEYWETVLTLGWVDSCRFAWQLTRDLSEIETENLILLKPILNKLFHYPQQRHGFLGAIIARCLTAEVVDDASLWRYISGEITETDIFEYELGDKLHCHPSDFGNDKNFLNNRVKESTALLDLIIQSIEQWSLSRISAQGNWGIGHSGFLEKTSYSKAHNYNSSQHSDNENFLMDAIASAIEYHAKMHSNWWEDNLERLCFSSDLALRYFSLLALTKSPEANIDLIGHLLCHKSFLESKLSFELSTLIKSAFIFLEPNVQDQAIRTILSIHVQYDDGDSSILWVLRNRMELIIAIPCHLRSAEAQEIFDTFEKRYGTFILQEEISRWGVILPPFSFEVFLNISDSNVLLLLQHYIEHDHSFDDFLVGGLDEVSTQLYEASTRSPLRFLSLLRTDREKVPKCFYGNILNGIAHYLSYRHGNLQSDGAWKPVEEPSATFLATEILDELEKHSDYLQLRREMTNLLQACANVVATTNDAARLLTMAIGFIDLNEKSTINGEKVKLLNIGLNMISGRVVEALMIVASRFHETETAFPQILVPTLRMLARDANAIHRSLILRRLPALQTKNSAFGWELFDLALKDDIAELWSIAEPCLYYSYHKHFEKIVPSLTHLRSKGKEKSLETWGRISALAALSEKIEFSIFLEDLEKLDSTDAWRGASSVWKHFQNFKQHRNQCSIGLITGLKSRDTHVNVVVREMRILFHKDATSLRLPTELVTRFFSALNQSNTDNRFDFFEIDKWLCATAQYDPLAALAVAEAYVTYIQSIQTQIYDHGNDFAQLLTRLFANAEEREESDNGVMLKRVVSLQDNFLLQGLNSIDEWLKAAERP